MTLLYNLWMKLYTYSAYNQDTDFGKDVFGLTDVHFHMKCFNNVLQMAYNRTYVIEINFCTQKIIITTGSVVGTNGLP